MTTKEQHVICTHCQQEFDATPKKSLLGFKKYKCPHCGNKVLYPMSVGQVVLNYGIVFIMLCMTISAVGSGAVVIPGGLGIIVLIAVVKDIITRVQVRKLEPRSIPQAPEATRSKPTPEPQTAEGSFKFHCPHCNQSLEAEPDMVGTQVECPACQQTFTVSQTA